MGTSRGPAKFTGKHMAAILVAGFGIVVAVNFYMASLAVSGFHGVVVENSYVASQHFNSWLDEAEKARALGWKVDASRDGEGYVVVSSEGVPDGAVVSAQLRRPLGPHELADLTFSSLGNGAYRSTRPAGPGRWTIRLHVESGDRKWAGESELE